MQTGSRRLSNGEEFQKVHQSRFGMRIFVKCLRPLKETNNTRDNLTTLCGCCTMHSFVIDVVENSEHC